MKKNFFLTLMLGLLCIATGRAQFAPVAGEMYALQEVTSGLYLDIQTLGINEPNANATTNNISLNFKPCVIYFAAGTTDNTRWTMKNVNGKYAMQATSRNWNAVVGTTATEWLIAETGTDTDLYTIARADGEYIGVDSPVNGAPLYCDRGTGLKFKLVEYSALRQAEYTLKSPTGTYLSWKTSGDTPASFWETATEFYVIPSAGTVLFEQVNSTGNYIGVSSNTWSASADFGVWKILDDEDADGYVQIERGNDNDTGKYLGSDNDSNVGTGIYTNVSSECNAWCFTGVYKNYATTATENGGKYEFTSGLIYTAGPCNKIRFTLTESDAYYSNSAKRLSFVSFVLYDAKGNVVPLTAGNITGNNGKVYNAMLDGTADTYTAGTWNNASATDDWFEIDLGKVNLEGAFKFSFVTENTTMNAKAFEIKMSYEKPADYIFGVNAPDGKDYSVTYNGEAIAAGDPIGVVSFDEELLVATEIAGYTWSVVVDDENKTITLVYTEAEVVENPAAVVALLNRIGGDGTADRFKIVLNPSMNSRQEEFVINGEDGKVLIKGTTLSAITTGIGWYLQNIAHINISWNSLNEKTVSGAAYADLSSIPVPTAEERHTSDAMYRYYLNTCVFGYSMTTWTWERWQQEIDWMALHGVNMPLQLVGLEEVWRKFLTMEEGGKRKYGYTDAQAKAFVPGPAFIAWWAMNNLQGWGGTAKGTDVGANNGNNSWDGSGGVQDDAWYARQKELAGKIVARQRALGMQPVLPGWSGMVPANFASISGYATRANGGWNGGFVRPLLLNVSNANYAEIAADYYACLHEVMGESQYYSMDPFHEGGGAGTMEDYEALYAAMEAAKPGSKWVIQQWQWSDTQEYSLTAVPAGRLVVLDLFADGNPAFDEYNGFAPQDAVFSIIPNFGGRSGLMGRLTNLTDNYFSYKAKYSTIKGIGAAPEAIEQTPVTYDLLFQLPWMNGVKPDVADWVSNYSIARYGVENEEIQEAWSLLRQGVLNYGADAIQGPVEDVWAAIPNLTATPASTWGKTLNAAGGTYTKERRQMLIDATYKLLSQNEALNFTDGSIYESNYNYDLVEFGGAVLADYAYDLLLGIASAKTSAGNAYETDATYIARRNAFLQLILDVDAFKGTNLNFRLGKWTQEARAAAQEAIDLGATEATADWYEYNNARTIISTWSSPDATTCLANFNARDLNDYSYRSWQGMMKDYYLPRWKHFFENGCENVEYDYFEWNWAHGKEHYVGQTAVSDVALTEGQAGHTSSYTREPEGNTVEVATEVLGKYIIPVAGLNGTYYAYRYLSNDLTSVCTVVASTGGFVDLSTYFGELEGATVSGDFIESATGTSTNFKALPIKSDAADGSHTGTITLTDGTVLTFAVVINPAFNGVYRISVKSYMNDSGTKTIDPAASVMVSYNTDNIDTFKSVGYKLVAEGTYSAAAAADTYFTITPLGLGYRLQAQGMYVCAPQDLSKWGHILFSDNSTDAGSYIFEETGEDTDVFKIKNATGNNPYLNAWDKYIFGNETASKYSTFTFTPLTKYTVNVPSTGYTTLYLPFNVVLPTGVTAYTVEPAKIVDDGNGGYGYILTQVAGAGETLLGGTPVIVKAAAGDYNFGVTVDNTGAKTSASSALRGTYFAKDVSSPETAKAYTVTVEDGVLVFARVDAETPVAANSCWLETGADVEKIAKLTTISLVDGGVYRIKGQLSDGTFRTLYTSGAKTNIWWTEETKTDASTLFVVKKEEDKYYLISALADGVWSNDRTLTENGVALTLVEGYVAPTYMIVGDGNRRFAVTGTGTSGKLNYYDNCNDAAGTYVSEENSTDFFFEQVNASEVSFTVKFKAEQEWATMFLPYAVSISGDADAYTSTTDDIDGSVITLTKIEDVIPARTAVLLNREVATAAANVKFSYSTELGGEYTDNLFRGFVQTTAVPVNKDTEKCYLLLNQRNGEAMYWVFAEYDENCVATDPGTDNGGHVKCDANKAYMLLSSALAPSAKYSFRFNGETTGIEEVESENGEAETIYDLQGRKLTEITEPGVYIIDGNKVLVK